MLAQAQRRTRAVEARRRTCDCRETGSMEKQQLGRLVVAGWLRGVRVRRDLPP